MARGHRPLSGCHAVVAAPFLLLLLSVVLPEQGSAQSPNGQVNGFISFSVTQLVVDENTGASFTTVQLPLIREVGATGTVLATVDVTNSTASEDFFSRNVVVAFADGVTTASATLILVNDAIPEGNETFIVQITSTRLGAEIGRQNTMELVVRANDEPYGQFQFSQSSLAVTVSEPITNGITVDLTVVRGPGVFGRVSVDFEVVGGPDLGVNDITPTQGQLVFLDQSSTQPLTITLTPDEVPEGNETFTLRLSNPRGGATLSDSATEAQLTILENDTPIRFSQLVTQVSEDAGSVDITVTRGLLEDGSQVGNTDVTTTVQLSTSDGTAMAGQDYTPQSLTLTFAPGSTSQTLTIPILSDNTPEGDESFSVTLSNPSSEAVLHVPSTATVVILVNDNGGGLVQFASPNAVVIGEDDGSVGRFTIQRTVGNFSSLIIEWEITSNIDGTLAVSDFQPATGNVTIPDGQAEAVLEIQAFDDTIPEVAEGFMVRLVRVISGAGMLNNVGVRVAPLFVTDSDGVYGLVEWADDSRLEVTATTPRELHLTVFRSGDSVGIISVDYSIVYLPVGITDPIRGNSSVVTMATGSVQLQSGQVSKELNVTISEDAFLEPRANFYAYLNSTMLVGGATVLVSRVNSPRIGPRSEVLVPVPITAANGYTSFSPESLQVMVEEPLLPSPVQLRVSRDGAYGEANVTWGVTLLDATLEDIGITAGVVTIPHGFSSAIIDITILPDDIPEVDKSFSVQLLSIIPTNQRIRTELNTATVTILQNDNAEGIFFISNTTRGPFIFQESSSDIIVITIEREGGALTNQLMRYEIPDGSQDLIGGFGFANFIANQRSFTVTILINDDTIPEIDETFIFTISAVDGNENILGSPTSVTITLLANDDFAGVFLFAASSLSLFVDEPRTNDSFSSSIATFTIQRDAGTFTNISVTWIVTSPGSGADIAPGMGTVTFEERQQFGTFEISALPDEIPEQNETFIVTLTNVTGEGRLASVSTEASLVVRQNDDPINFNGSSVEATEGDIALFTIVRGGQSSGVAEVSFVVLYDTASTSDVMVVTPPTGIVVLGGGVREGMISVMVVEDEMPEESETLRIQLTSTTGDAVIVSPSEATLVILPSDDPNGVFQFAPVSRMVTASEGTFVQLRVDRLRGRYGTVDLRWTIYQLNTSSGTRYPARISDLSPTSNLVSFADGNMSNTVEFTVMDDALPEFDEFFEVELSIEAVLGDSATGARLGNFTIAMIVVPENNDPYGLFQVAEGSRMVEVAEDVPTDQPELGSATIHVERTFGTLGDVQVTWEILPPVEPYPPFVDLFFFGTASPSVPPFPSRNDTGTVALMFSGVTGSIVTVPPQYHPTGINSRFAISLWLQPSTGSSGVLVAKTTGGGSTRFYAVALVADGESFIIRLSYLPASLQTGSRSVEVSVLQSTLADGSWHSLIVSVNNGTAFFYVDGAPVSSRSLGESFIRDGVGDLTVGGLPSGESYNGAMQDVRIYTDALSESQVMALASDAASAALTPISGYLLFSAGENLQSITTTSKDDSIPEPSQFFTVQLGNTDGGARIDTEGGTAILTVLKSDAGNGIFGFDPLSLSNVITEPGNVSLVVNRDGGMFETVFVSWEVREVVGGVIGGLATQDFNLASGRLVFAEDVAQLVLPLSTVDELVPELDEDFVVILTSATADDNQTSSTPTSGASIDSSRAASNITVLENDYPFGLIQFVTSPPSPGDRIPPAISMPEVSVDESDGAITVFVVRSQGNLGTVQVEYLTLDGTARSSGVRPDYVSSVGTLTFGPSDVVQTFSLTLLDDSTPELEKVFFVNLTNPSGNIGTPGLSIGSTLAINIQPSDDAYGRFGFRTDSVARVVEERIGGTPVTLTVTRDGGTFGNVSVYWEVDGPLGDISPIAGVVEFAEDQVEGELVVTVADDMDPELLEVFNIRLVNASGGGVLSTTGNTVSTVTVRANDHPYGRFVFSQAFRPLEVGEGVGNVEVTVTREFGTVGMVRVEFATITSDNLLASPALVGIIDVAQLVRNSNIATTDADYLSIDGTLEFGPGETSKSFTLTIVEDTAPELREYVFVAITSIELNTSSVGTVDPAAAPTLLAGNESLAFILISENDDARGVIQFTSPEISTTEPSQNFVFLARTAGTFGEVSVQWEATPITADTMDYTPPGGTVTFLPGVNETALPLTIIDDTFPEFMENLTLRLVGVSGGARVGVVVSTVVNILANDDPNGALEFAPGSRTREVAEPNGNTPLTVTLTVRRQGGVAGVIQAVWNVTASNGSPAMADILPVSGTLQFVSNVVEQDIELSVLPDDIPEVAESFVVQLVSVDGGARIGDVSMATVLIQRNDNPYGIVSFDSRTSVVMEGDSDTVAMVPVTRSRGTFGELRVTYTVQSADAASLATANGTMAVSYFSPPVPNVALNRSALLMEVGITMATDRLGECARACLSSQACQSFASDGVALCQLYLATQSASNAVTQIGVSYYEKNDNLVQPFYQAIATVGIDFTSAIGASIVIPEGSNQSAIPVTILGDTTPELNESLVVVLTSVDVVMGNGEGSAILGAIPETTVVIFENDDPHGEFYLVASDGGSVVRMMEPVGFDIGVTLTVERRGGTIGEVQVRWDVLGGTATEAQDYAGSGGTLTFADRVIRLSIAITILQDDIPERDEDLLVGLLNPTGGATVAPGNGGTTLIIIRANDNAAGVVGLAPLSRSAVVGEGEVVALSVQRAVGALGVVAVVWNISGPGNVTEEFVNVTGTDVFEEGNSLTEISIAVRADSTPEVSSSYTLTLLSVLTISDDVGQATLDPQASQATITVRASDNPHGVVEFQATSVFVSTEEASPVQLTIVRQFGTFGAIDVGYSAVAGNLSSLPPDTSLATPVEDFTTQLEIVRLESGQQSTVIPIPIVDDSVPEFNEVFLVRLTSVSLVDPQNSTILPSIGARGEAEVTITPSDSPQGEFTFLRDSFTVEESVGVLEVMVERDQGLVGEVSVVYFVTDEGATNGEDFVVDSLNELTFAMGQSQISIMINVVDDTVPEDNERFCVRLSLPEGGATLGNITEMCVTISANDDAFGVFSFNQSSLFTSLQETQGSPSSSSVAELRVERTGGAFRQVTVPFEVEPAGRQDLSLGMGALVFQPTETFRIIQLEALMDMIPELDETYNITLLPPLNLGRLATSATVATITILANQDPYGVLEIFPSNNASSVTVEENTQYVEFEIRRTFGTFGEVSVTMATTEGTAVAPSGNVVSFAATQLLDTVSAEKWLQFSRGSGQQYLVLASSSASGGSVLYAWRGAFTPVQTLSTVGARAFTFLSLANGQDLLVAANGGSPGNREVNSTVYQFTPAGQLEVLQSIPTMGASDVVAFQTTSRDWYLVIANSGDNMDNPNVDSLVLRWNGTAFQQSQILSSIGASALKLFSISSALYLAVTSLTDTRSQVFVWQNSQFRLDHTFNSQQAADVEFIDLQTVQYLAVASETTGVSLLVWSPVTRRFTANTTINATRPVRVEAIPGMMSSLVVTNNGSAGQVFGLEGAPSEMQDFVLPPSRHLYPFMLGGGLFIAAAVASAPGTVEQSIIEEQVLINSSADFYSRNITLTFAPEQSSHQVAIEIINDNTPEVNETFDIQLLNPGGGARLGSQTSVPVTILTNDDAHGVVGFALSSQSVIVQELEALSTVTLEVVRSGGAFGRVRVSWEITGEHMQGEVTPTSGEVDFADGVSVSTIVLLIQPDLFPELNEVTRVTLTGVLENGVAVGGDPTRGARLAPAGQTTAVVTVQANDAPHGVVVWSPSVVMVTEEEEVDSVVQLTLIREFGSIGAIIISYGTDMASGLPADQLAVSREDFLPATGSIAMGDGETSTSINITILHDNTPELTESFLVNITDVRLADEGDRQGSSSDSPRTVTGNESVVVRITENDDSRGRLSFAVTNVSVEENAGFVSIPLTRTGGTFGTVGVGFVTTGITATGGGVDYSPDSGTVLTQNGGLTLEINITNDVIPELEEVFQVTLVSGLGGAQIESPTSANVTILRNDDINGVFSFADSSLLFLILEGQNASLTVQRTRNFVGTVTVYWEIASDGVHDLEPTRGNLTFDENVREQSFQVTAITDAISELFESFVVTLVSVDGGGRIVDQREARIAIRSSDDPQGVVAFDSYPQGIIINEGDQLMLRMLRSGGVQGLVSATWSILPVDSSVFVTTSDTVVFTSGQTDATITVQTLSDSIPEVARLFSFRITSTNFVRVDINASDVDIFVTASDSPHGVVQFAPPFQVDTQEDTAILMLPLQRSFGVIGPLRVNFSVTPNTAQTPEDFTVSSQSVIIPRDSASGSITVGIINDNIPELQESFSVLLQSVELAEDINGGRDFIFDRDPSLIDSLPSLGVNTRIEVRILQNDNPFGTISITNTVFRVNEGETAAISLTRLGGTFGSVSVQYNIVDGRAIGGADYDLPRSGTVIITAGMSTGDILIPITDDSVGELQEDFTIQISLVPGSAGTLGAITSATVIIEASDSLFGVIGFSQTGVRGIRVTNPTTEQGPSSYTLSVVRSNGLNGTTQITWSLTGPDPGREREDIDSNTLGGILTLQNGQSRGLILITVLPSSGPEPEETFTITLISASNNVNIDPLLANATITVLQRGMPFGTIGFFGDALSIQVVEEELSTHSFSLPLARTGSSVGTVSVGFFVTRVGGGNPETDVTPSSGSVSFASGQTQANLDLQILADSEPELNETFTVTLTQVVGGASLDPQATVSTFVIRYNDAPYGLFGFSSSLVSASNSGDSIMRTLNFNITRTMGSMNSVVVQVTSTYNPDPSATYVTRIVSRTFAEDVTEAAVSLPITPGAYLAPDSSFTITITSASVTLSPEILVDISPTLGSIQATVTEEVSNPQVGFDPTSVNATINDTALDANVVLLVTRQGLLGNIRVSWTASLPGSLLAAGSVSPGTGTLVLGPSDRNAMISLRATPRYPHGEPELFAVQLSVDSLTPQFPARVDSSLAVTYIEPQGVVQLGRDSYSGIEGREVSITVWRRYGSMGDILVRGSATVAPSNSIPANHIAATEVADFAVTPPPTVIPDGATVGTINISLPDNAMISSLKVFQFTLTAVERVPLATATSPRLSSANLSSLVTIIDDEGGAGLFRFSLTSPTALEGTPKPITIIREGGSAGRVTVIVRTSDGATAPATADTDYLPVDQELTFEDGETSMSLTLTILDDNQPELTEYFTISLFNPVGGDAFIDPDASTFQVAIMENDNPRGNFSLSPSSLTLSEDSSPSGTLTITRDDGRFESVQIDWEAVYTGQQNVLVINSATVNFTAGQSSAVIVLQLRQNGVPASGEQFVIRIRSSAAGISFGRTETAVTAIPRMSAVFQFGEPSRRVVSNGENVNLEVQRVNGSQLTVTVSFSTRAEQLVTVSNQLTFDPALAGTHFTATSGTLTFNPGENVMSIPISIIAIDSTQPRAFYVNITVNIPHLVQFSQAVVVLNSQGPLSSLYNTYFNTLTASTLQDLESVTTGLLELLRGTTSEAVSGTVRNQSDTTRYIVDEVVQRVGSIRANSLTSRRKRYTTQLITNLLDIFERVFGDLSFSQRSRFVQSMHIFADSLLNTTECPSSNSEVMMVYSRPLFYLEVLRLHPMNLIDRRFSSSVGNNFIRFPSQSILPGVECLDVHYIEFFTERMFMEPTLNSKAQSISIRVPPSSGPITYPPSTAPLTYRVSASLGTLPDINACLLWQYPTMEQQFGSWDSQTCTPVVPSILQVDYVECQCSSLGEFAVSGAAEIAYGWSLPAALSAAVVMIVIIPVVLLHLCYRNRTQLATRILTALCVSIFLFELMILIDVFASDSSNTTVGGCAAMGGLLQFTALFQFLWILALAIALWVNFMGFTDGKEPLIIYVLVTCGTTILIVVATILIGRFAVGLDLATQLYGRNGDFCFMPLLSVSLVSTVLPIIVAVLATTALLSHSCVYWSRWEDFHNIYHDSFNRTEIPLLLVFFVLIFLTSVAGYLHIYLREVYTFGAFIALNVIQGVYLLVVYFFVSCHTLTQKHKKYGIGDEVEPLTIPEEPDYLGSLSTLASSRQQLIPEEEMEREEHEPSPPVVPLGVKRVPSETSLQQETGEDSHLDDLMFMLKTQTYSPTDDTFEMESTTKKPSGSEQLQYRRISIADTHL